MSPQKAFFLRSMHPAPAIPLHLLPFKRWARVVDLATPASDHPSCKKDHSDASQGLLEQLVSIGFAPGEQVCSLIVVEGEGDILTASENGYGKRTAISEFPVKGRGTQGVIALKTSDRNGSLVGAIQLTDHHDVLLISDGGTLVRTPAGDIAQVGRNTQGVTLIRMAKDEKLQAIERLDASLDEPADAVADAAAASVQADQPNAS